MGEEAAPLREQAAIVTGAASGIGRAIAEVLAGAGARLLLADVDPRVAAVAKRIGGRGGEAAATEADVATASGCDAVVGRAKDLYGGVDVLVNGAGIIRRANVLETSEQAWDEVMGANVKSVFLLSRAVIPGMAERGDGSIINISSAWGIAAGASAAAYCASKGAVVQLTRAMAVDHARQGIRVNCICPGDTDTPMIAVEAEAMGVPLAEFVRQGSLRPVGRIGRPEEIAEAALYLAAEAGPFVTGMTLVIDGGGLLG